MIFPDTSVWIEFFKGNEPYAGRLRHLLEFGEVITSELIFSELLQGARTTREREILEKYWLNLPKVDINGILIEAGRTSSQLKWVHTGVGLIDAAIAVSVRRAGARLWTLDKKLAKVMKEEELFRE